MSGRGSGIVFVPQSRRGHATGSVDRRPSLYGTAQCLSLSQGSRRRLFVPAAGPELGRRAQERRRFTHVGKRRHRRNRSKRQGAVATQTVRQARGFDAAGQRRFSRRGEAPAITDQTPKGVSQPNPSGKPVSSTPPASAVSPAAAAPASPGATTSTVG